MEYKILPYENSSNLPIIELNLITSKKQLKEILKAHEQFLVCLDFNSLNLGQPLYGESKSQTISMQKFNCKKITQAYKKVKKFLHILKRSGFDGNFYVSNLSTKKNNNDIMFAGLCKLHDTFFLKRMTTAMMVACDFLDAENSLNKMCDFKDNSCAKHRARGFKTTTGCCPASCKFQGNCPCKTKNLSCKLIMCDYLIDKGFYFTPHTLASLKLNMTYIERVTSWGLFFKSTKKSFWFMWTARILFCLVMFMAIYEFVNIFI